MTMGINGSCIAGSCHHDRRLHATSPNRTRRVQRWGMAGEGHTHRNRCGSVCAISLTMALVLERSLRTLLYRCYRGVGVALTL
jgi:hypothetical protein